MKKAKFRCSAIAQKVQGENGTRCRRVGKFKMLLSNGDDTSVVMLCLHHDKLLEASAIVVVDDAGEYWAIPSPVKS